MKHIILMITSILVVLKESYPLNPEIQKYDRYMRDFEVTGRQLKQEKNKEMNPLIVKREDQNTEDTLNDGICDKDSKQSLGKVNVPSEKLIKVTLLHDTLKPKSNFQKASDLSQPPTLSKEAFQNEEPPKEKESEQNTEEEVTDKIRPPRPEPIDEFYNYEEPLDEFNNYKPQIIYDWKHVQNAYDVKDIKFLRYFCMKVHELAGWGKVNVTDDFILDRSSIRYKNPAYFPTDTDFLQYVIQLPKDGNQTQDHFYLTEGLKEDCVFYLIPTSLELNAFELGHHVCDIHRALRGSRNITDPAAGAAR